MNTPEWAVPSSKGEAYLRLLVAPVISIPALIAVIFQFTTGHEICLEENGCPEVLEMVVSISVAIVFGCGITCWHWLARKARQRSIDSGDASQRLYWYVLMSPTAIRAAAFKVNLPTNAAICLQYVSLALFVGGGIVANVS